jgi:hypothetical protein
MSGDLVATGIVSLLEVLLYQADRTGDSGTCHGCSAIFGIRRLSVS